MFAISDEPFFDQKATQEAIEALVDVDHLTLYCASGTTRDRTNLGWTDAIARAFPDFKGDPIADHHFAFLSRELQPPQFASLLYMYGLERHGKKERELRNDVARHLSNALYQGTEWQAGLLCSMLAELAYTSAALGRSVTVLTTNYDVHIEAQLNRAAARLRAAGMPKVAIKHVTNLVGHTADGPAGEIRVVYLHGRLDRTGKVNGTLVLTEVDYTETRGVVVAALEAEIGRDRSACVIMGSSLNDPPLIDALVRTRRPGDRDCARIALVSYDSFKLHTKPQEEAPVVADHLLRRTELLGVQLLVPDFKSQIAQFCEEAKVAAVTRRLPVPGKSRTVYREDLEDWWDEWHQSKRATSDKMLQKRLSSRHEQVRRLLAAARAGGGGGAVTRERTRLELWVRNDPSDRIRILRRWATSDYVRGENAERKYAPISHHSDIVTVQAFVDGRPKHADKSHLQSQSDPSATWKSFLSVPIYSLLSGHHRVALGVVTLASSAPQEHSALKLGKTEWMESLTALLIAIGEELLADIEPPGPMTLPRASAKWLADFETELRARLTSMTSKSAAHVAGVNEAIEVALTLESARLTGVRALRTDLDAATALRESGLLEA